MIARIAAPLAWGAVITSLVFACATPIADDVVLGVRADASPPMFTTPDASTDAGEAGATPPSETRGLCIATTCPWPYGSCIDGASCETNLSNDSNNCGACGNACPTSFPYRNMTSACVNGACQPQCKKQLGWGGEKTFADCNGTIEDGCETNVSDDPNNCGTCGNKCADGVRCIDGKCGCGAGQTDCNGQCVDVKSDNDHCGVCGNKCAYPTDAGAPPPHMEYGCVNGQCGEPRCISYPWETWANCNGDLFDGCEVALRGGPRDPKNCGACGNKCVGDQVCWDLTGDGVPECVCQPNETRCGSPETYDLGCYDLLTSVESCGACGHRCSADAEHTKSACKKGLCEIECEAGWADCDDNPNNGCETNIASSGANCGACGHRCDTQAGQPCIEGKCAMTECDTGIGPK